MNNLWYEIKKLGFMQIDKDCKLCQQSLKQFKHVRMTKNEVMLIIPSVNTFGIVTHYHIGRTNRQSIRDLDIKILKDVKQ